MRSLDCRSEVALSAKQERKTTISCLPSYDPHRPAHRRAHQPLNQRGTPRAGTRPRQQCRPSPQGAEEEDATRGHLPRDEAPRPLRETLREESPREGGSHPPRPQARAQEIAARGPAADEASGDPRGPGKRRPRARPPLLISEPPIENPPSSAWWDSWGNEVSNDISPAAVEATSGLSIAKLFSRQR